jgi:hypothetical protein
MTKKGEILDPEIDVGLRDDMVRFIKDRIIKDLQAIKQFLELNVKEYDDICAGMYTYAVEEYGKILFLRGLNPIPPNNNKIKVPYSHHNQGFRDHDHKFDISLKALPNSCKTLSGGGFTSSGFLASGFITDAPADMKARMSVFYADFDKNNKYSSILGPLEVNRDLLARAVDDFLAFIEQQNYP